MSIITPGRARDFTIYIAIALTFAAVIGWTAMHSTEAGAEVFGKWGGLVVNTCIVFGYTLRYRRRYWNRPLFWTILLALLGAHVVLFVFLLERISEGRIPWWAIATPLEYLGIGSLLALAGFRGGHLRP